MKAALTASILTFVLACTGDQPAEVEVIDQTVALSLQDSGQQHILELQDRREAQSIAAYLASENPTYRYLAANAFASLPDSGYAADLSQLLMDPSHEVQQVSAYALGQLGQPESEPLLISCFQRQDSLGANSPLSATLLEAIGKCGGESTLRHLATVSTFRPTDHHLIEGQVKAIYRFMQRGLVASEGTELMITVLTNSAFRLNEQIYAANYLARVNDNLDPYFEQMSSIWKATDHPDIRMFLALAMGKTQLPDAMNLLVQSVGSEKDYRVVCNILRSLGANFYDDAKRTIHRYLYDPNIQISSTAVQVIVNHGNRRYWKEYLNLSLGNYPWQVKIGLLHATNKYIPGGNQMFQKINEDILRQRINNSKNIYERAAAVEALAENPARFRYAVNLYRNAEEPVLRTASIDGLASIASKAEFNRLSAANRKAIIDILLEALQSGDGGEAAIAARFLESEHIDFKAYNIDPAFVLGEALDGLELPRDISAWRSLQSVLSKFTGEPGEEVLPYIHAVDWHNLQDITDSTRVTIHTQKGSFVIRLLPYAAPGTVANFVELIRLRYFDDKVFHRVVPNFVIQGGGSRGDGYGRLDYTIRSEFNQRYYDKAGYVGMASSGRDTESVQWFVTHSPTPHLDGKYTQFAQVVSGMNVVDKIEKGTKIDSLTIR